MKRPAPHPSTEPVPELPPGIPSGREYYETSLTVALLRARESTMRRFKPFADAQGLSLPQWRVLRALADGEPLDASTLGQRCVILAPSLTRILRALAERGLLRQVACSDGRRHLVELTAEGYEIVQRLVVRTDSVAREIRAAFGEERMAELLDMLNDLRRVTESLPEPSGDETP